MSESVKVVFIVGFSLVLVVALCFGGWATTRNLAVWSQGIEGQAELARAEQSRKIAIVEAMAKMESAKSLAQADIERARGAAEANKILGESLKGNEDYLRYLWIQGLEHGGNSPTVIYVPTEAGLPILEAHRLAKVEGK